MNRPHRATRTSLGAAGRVSQGEYVGTRRQHAMLRGSAELDKIAQGAQTSVSLSVILASKDIKVRKWKRALVQLGQLKAPRWLPEQPKVTEELQKYKPAIAQNKKPLKRARKRSEGGASARVQILGEIDDDGCVIDTDLRAGDEDDDDDQDDDA